MVAALAKTVGTAVIALLAAACLTQQINGFVPVAPIATPGHSRRAVATCGLHFSARPSIGARLPCHYQPGRSISRHTTLIRSARTDDNVEDDGATAKDELFDGRTTLSLVGGQSLLIVAAVIAAYILGTPNLGLGDGFDFNADAVRLGALYTIPLFLLAAFLDVVEERVPALQDVSKATQRSVLALLGGTQKPFIALGTALSLGAAAGIGEEMLFRGVLQSELASRFGETVALASSSVVFGLLHAVTPLYAALATVASVFFGVLYVDSHNLAVPIVCHGLYDVGALLWAHASVVAMSEAEREEIRNWQGPGAAPILSTSSANDDEP